MPKLTFSKHFNLQKSQYELDFVDIPLNSGDIPLFIDPYSISLRQDRWSVDCHNLIVGFFQEVIDAIRNNEEAKAKLMLSGLKEPNETFFGLSSGKKPRGRGVGGQQSEDLYKALAESTAVRTGFIKDLEDCELLIEGIGRDKISDISTNVIRLKLIDYTVLQCEFLDIPVQQVASGPIWHDGRWSSAYVNLPVFQDRKIILVPKAVARWDIEYSHQEYYNHFVLNFLQAEHLSANSSLVRTLKDGTKRPPSKKDLKERFPLSKHFLYEFSKNHPEILNNYKQSKARGIPEISNKIIIGMIDEKVPEPDIDGLKERLRAIAPGNDGAAQYHDLMKGILEYIFYPSLINPKKEQGIHEGRKRIDIVFENAAKTGFFQSLPQIKRVPSAYIMIECKNYSGDPANPELDQLSGRFSINRGQFGILACRTFANKDLFCARCKDTVSDGRGFIVPIDDEDVCALLDFKGNADETSINGFLDQKYRKLVM